MTKKKRENAHETKDRNDSGDIATDLTEIKRIIREYYEKLYNNKLDNLDELEKFLETYKLPDSRRNRKP